MTEGSSMTRRHSGLILALRQVKDPFLFLALPVAFAIFYFPDLSSDIGFDFIGTLWEPAKAFVNGEAIYPEPTRASIEIGNPAVYPPPFILATVPLTVLPEQVAAWLWSLALAAGVVASLRILGIRDWRCYTLALTSPLVLHSVYWGNLSLAVIVPVALAWRFRSQAAIAGAAIGVGVAAKLFVWPLVVWLVLTRRYAAAGIAASSAAAIVLGSWAAIGFDGFGDYPALLSVLQDVYATRSYSIAAVMAGLGASTELAVAASTCAGVAVLALAALVVRRRDGDRRSFVLAVGACVVASPIVWQSYAALLFVPIAVTWPRFAPVWLFSYPIWLAGLLPKPKAAFPEPCCRPPDVPEMVWALSHAKPVPWFAAGVIGTVLAVGVWIAVSNPREDVLRPRRG